MTNFPITPCRIKPCDRLIPVSSLSFNTTSIQKFTQLHQDNNYPSSLRRMNDGAILAIVFSSYIGVFVLMCILGALWDCHCRRPRRKRARTTLNAPLESPLPTSVQKTGDAIDGCDETETEIETEASAPPYTKDGSLVLPPPPPPAMMRESSGFSLGPPHRQSSSSTGSTLLPMYMDGSEK